MADHFKNFDELFRDEREPSRPQRPTQRPAQPARRRPQQQEGQPRAARPRPAQQHVQHRTERPARPQPEQTHAVHRQPAPRHEPTQEPEVQQRAGRSGCLGGLIYFAFVVSVSIILACVGWMAASDVLALNKEPVTATVTLDKAEFQDVTISYTDSEGNAKERAGHQVSVGYVAKQLKDAGIIKYKGLFQLYCSVSHAKTKIDPGTYELSTNYDYRALVKKMQVGSGAMVTTKVTIPEGYTVRQTIRLLAEKGVNTEENLLEAVRTATYDYSFINNNSEDPSRLEGYLFPDTYEFYKNHNAKNALGKLIDAFADRIDEDAFASSKAKSMGYSMKDVVIIASLIEKETDGTDQRDIASVIYNRLQKPGETVGLLQIDASLLYGLPDHTGAITNADKAVDTPYNLYLHKGLPPTAIANPGSAALKAAMDPNDTDYYYYALGTDGKHHFSKTLSEHNAFVGSSSYGG